MKLALFLFASGRLIPLFRGEILELNRSAYEALHGPLDVDKYKRIWGIGAVLILLLSAFQCAFSAMGVELLTF